MNINVTLNELLVRLFRDITMIEEKAIRTDEYANLTTNDMHVIEAIGTDAVKNMSTVAKALSVTTGTLTIAVNGLVKKGFVNRVRSEEDRRVVLLKSSMSRLRAQPLPCCFSRQCKGKYSRVLYLRLTSNHTASSFLLPLHLG